MTGRIEHIVDCSVTPQMEREEGAIPAWDVELTEEEYAARRLGYVPPEVLARRELEHAALDRIRARMETDEGMRDLAIVLGIDRSSHA